MKKLFIIVVLLLFALCGMQTVYASTQTVTSESAHTEINYLDEAYFKLYPIANTSVEETFTDEMPAGWSNNCWGSNTTTLTYLKGITESTA